MVVLLRKLYFFADDEFRVQQGCSRMEHILEEGFQERDQHNIKVVLTTLLTAIIFQSPTFLCFNQPFFTNFLYTDSNMELSQSFKKSPYETIL